MEALDLVQPTLPQRRVLFSEEAIAPPCEHNAHLIGNRHEVPIFIPNPNLPPETVVEYVFKPKAQRVREFEKFGLF
jgi:hypothetical protein